MKCKVCGTDNESYLEYCKNCAAPLDQDEGPAVAAAPAYTDNKRDDQAPADSRTWGFVKSPQWPTPDFDADTVRADDLPENYFRRFEPRPAAPEPAAVSHVSEPVTAPAYSAKAPRKKPLRFDTQTGKPIYGFDPQTGAPLFDSDEEDDQTTVRIEPAPVPADTYDYTSQQPETVVDDGYDEGYDDEYEDEYEYEDEPVDNGGRRYAPPIEDEKFFDSYAGGSKPASSRRPRSRAGRRSFGNKNMLPLLIAISGVLVVIIAVLAIFVVKWPTGQVDTNGDALKSTLSSRWFSSSPVTNPPTVEETTTKSGAAGYLITIYARDGYTVRFTGGTLVREHPITDGSLGLSIPSEIWIPDEPLEVDQVEITPDVVLISPSGEETPVEFEQTLVIPVPAVNLTMTSPATAQYTTDSATVEFTGKVDDNTVSVFIIDTNGENELSKDESGNFSFTYTLASEGTADITIEARKNGCKTARTSYSIQYGSSTEPATGGNPVTGNITLEFDALEPRTLNSTYTVTGTTDPAATITVAGVELSAQPTVDPSTGKFSFTITMNDVGLYTADVSTTKDGAVTTKTLYAERAHSDKNAYMEGTHKMDMSRLINEPYHKQAYLIPGKVAEVIQTEPFFIIRLTTSEGDVMFYYFNNLFTPEEFSVGTSLRLYADPYGKDEDSGLPLVYAWYIKKG